MQRKIKQNSYDILSLRQKEQEQPHATSSVTIFYKTAVRTKRMHNAGTQRECHRESAYIEAGKGNGCLLATDYRPHSSLRPKRRLKLLNTKIIQKK